MNEAKVVKIAGVLTTILGMGLTLLSNWVQDRQMEEKIREKVEEIFAEREKEEG